VGSDSGVTHLAAACGANTVALFGPTQPAAWGPRGERVAILRRHAGCAACARGERAGHTCLAAIDVEEALEAVLGGGLR
jgi:ADP-heptose:LPS heptosyltransferase